MTRARLPLVIIAALCAILAGCAGTATKKMEKVSPGEVMARIELAETHIGNAEYRRSLQELNAVSRQAGNLPRYNYDLGITYMGLREWDRAAKALERAVELDPEYGQAWNLLAQAYVAQDRIDEAVTTFEKAMSILTYLTPEYPAYNLAKLYQDLDESDKAMHYARVAMDKNWRFTPAYLMLADLLLEKGQTEEAVAVLTQGAEADPENTELLLRLAENQLRLGNTHEAHKWFQHIVTLAPDSQAAKVAQDYLDLSR